jgi:hypothetical protein
MASQCVHPRRPPRSCRRRGCGRRPFPPPLNPFRMTEKTREQIKGRRKRPGRRGFPAARTPNETARHLTASSRRRRHPVGLAPTHVMRRPQDCSSGYGFLTQRPVVVAADSGTGEAIGDAGLGPLGHPFRERQTAGLAQPLGTWEKLPGETGGGGDRMEELARNVRESQKRVRVCDIEAPRCANCVFARWWVLSRSHRFDRHMIYRKTGLCRYTRGSNKN